MLNVIKAGQDCLKKVISKTLCHVLKSGAIVEGFPKRKDYFKQSAPKRGSAN
jgi:hypothetical protein